jgi:O-antigen/teichoic acid export membrane protein
MRDKIKRLGTETAVYGISTIVGRFLNFLLVPFYTNILPPGEYGIVAYVYSIVAFVNVLYSYGMESAYFKYSSTLEIGSRKENFSTPFVSLFGSTVLFSILILGLSAPIAGLMNVPVRFGVVIPLSAGMLAFDALAIIPFASLRMEHKAGYFASVKSLNIIINVGMNCLLLLVFKMGVTGVFISGFVASAATLIMLLPTILREMTFRFNLPLWKSLLRFGLPYLPSGLSAMAMQVIDRPILRALTDDATVGIYQANYRLGIFMMLVVSMYDYAWRPFFFATAKEPDAERVFSRVMTYLLLMMSAVGILLTLFIDNIAMLQIAGRHLIGERYWGGLGIVPVVLFGYVFLGAATNLGAGIYITKKTQWLPVVTFAGAAVNIIVNLLLIPVWGMAGAAWATFAAYAAQAAATYLVVRKIYPVRYETGRIVKITLAVGVILGLYYGIPFRSFIDSHFLHALWKGGLFLLFICMIWGMRFFNRSELAFIRRMVAGKKGMPAPAEGDTPSVG